MRRSFIVFFRTALMASTVSSTALADSAAQPETFASLRVDGVNATFAVAVQVAHPAGYQVEIDCVSGCSSAVSYREPVGDSPLGLFTRDQDDLIFSTWTSGSGYRVRVWRASNAGIRKVAELSSRGRPDFQSDRFGRSTIRTFEREGSTGPFYPILWTYQGGSFEHGKRKVR